MFTFLSKTTAIPRKQGIAESDQFHFIIKVLITFVKPSLAQSEEEKEVSCVYRADGTKSLGAILNECGMTMAEFFEKNNPEQIIIAADVLFEVPKKV